MAERSVETKIRPLSKKRPSSMSKAERSKKVEVRPGAKSASGPSKTLTDDLLAKEEQYRLLNAELEAKTADLVKQAEELMKDQSEVLSKPLSTPLLTDIVDEEDSRSKKHQQAAVQEQVVTKKRLTSKSQGKVSHGQTTASKASHMDHPAAVETSADCFLAEAIQSMKERMNNSISLENIVDDVPNTGDDVDSGISEARERVFKAKLRIMQEEVDHLSCEYFKKEDENARLSAKIKEIEEDRARLQKTTSIQQTQIEKHRALAEQSAKKCEGLQLQVSTLNKEIENLNRSHKQAAAVHSTTEVRLNRALEEVERLKTQLNNMKQTNKDKTSEQHQSTENLLAENKMLKKQTAELVVGFKKQLKLIDILKRQKMHFEAAKLLSFTEDEFMKALDWGKS